MSSNKNNRVKRLEKEVYKFMQEQDDERLRLDEENSNLRKLIDVQADCFKAREQRLQWEIAALKTQHNTMQFCIKSHNEVSNATIKLMCELAEDIGDFKDELRRITGEVIRIGNGLQDAAGTFLGRTVLKYFRKGGEDESDITYKGPSRKI